MPWHRREVVSIGSKQAGIACGEGKLLTIKPFKIQATPEVSVREIEKGVFSLQNDQLKIEVAGGVITSLYDRKEEREVIPKGGKANQLVVVSDKS